MKKKMTKCWNVLGALLYQELMIVMCAADFLKLTVASWEQTIDVDGADGVGGTVVSGVDVVQHFFHIVNATMYRILPYSFVNTLFNGHSVGSGFTKFDYENINYLFKYFKKLVKFSNYLSNL
jgi:hypothetical protein